MTEAPSRYKTQSVQNVKPSKLQTTRSYETNPLVDKVTSCWCDVSEEEKEEERSDAEYTCQFVSLTKYSVYSLAAVRIHLQCDMPAQSSYDEGRN